MGLAGIMVSLDGGLGGRLARWRLGVARQRHQPRLIEQPLRQGRGAGAREDVPVLG